MHSQQQLQSDGGHPLLSVTFDKEPGQRSIPLATFAVTTILQACRQGFAVFPLRFAFHVAHLSENYIPGCILVSSGENIARLLPSSLLKHKPITRIS